MQVAGLDVNFAVIFGDVEMEDDGQLRAARGIRGKCFLDGFNARRRVEQRPNLRLSQNQHITFHGASLSPGALHFHEGVKRSHGRGRARAAGSTRLNAMTIPASGGKHEQVSLPKYESG